MQLHKIISLPHTEKFIKHNLDSYITEQSFTRLTFYENLNEKLSILTKKKQLSITDISRLMGSLFYNSILFTFNIKLNQTKNGTFSDLKKHISQLDKQKEKIVYSKPVDLPPFSIPLQGILKLAIRTYRGLKEALIKDLSPRLIPLAVEKDLASQLMNVVREISHVNPQKVYEELVKHYCSFCLTHQIHTSTLLSSFEMINHEILSSDLFEKAELT